MMAGELRNYFPDKVLVTWALAVGGALDLTEGLIVGAGAIQEAMNADSNQTRVDRQGNAVTNFSSDESGTLTLTYVAEAQIQSALMVIYNLDRQLGTQVGAITIRDLSGDTLMVYAGARIKKRPDMGFGDAAADRPWVWSFVKPAGVVGGATPL